MFFEFFHIIDWLTQIRTLLIILWSGLGVLSLALIILMMTRWGQAKPMSKCVVLSLLAHLLLAGYAYTTRFFSEIPTMPFRDELRIAVVANEDTESLEYESSRERQAWERFQKIPAPPAEGLARAPVVDQPVPSDRQNENKMAMSHVVSDVVRPSDIERPLPALPVAFRPPQEVEPAVPLEQEALQSDHDQQEELVLPAADPLERAVVVDQPSRVTEVVDQESEHSQASGQDSAMLERLVGLANTTKPSDSMTRSEFQRRLEWPVPNRPFTGFKTWLNRQRFQRRVTEMRKGLRVRDTWLTVNRYRNFTAGANWKIEMIWQVSAVRVVEQNMLLNRLSSGSIDTKAKMDDGTRIC